MQSQQNDERDARERERERELLDAALLAAEATRLDGPRLAYSRALGPAIQASLARLGSTTATREETLDAELELQRALVVDALDAYETAVAAASKTTQDPAKLSAVRLAASHVVHGAVAQVRETAVANARIRAQRDGLVDARALQPVVLEMTQAVDDELRARADRLRAADIDPAEFVAAVSRRLAAAQTPLLAGVPTTTELEPADAEAAAMDATVPRVTEAA